MNKYDYNNLTPFKWFVLENFPFIEADFDALTNWQLFCKLGKEMNKLIDTMNNVGQGMEDFSQELINSFNEFTTEINTTVEDYITRFNQLKDFVDNYFDNLDVQEEINNKLDDMVEAGTLQEIISDYLNSKAVFGYDTVADMKEATNLIDGSFAKTLGFYAKNDSGASLYKIRELLNNETANNMNLIELDNGLVAELIIENDTINIMQFGAYENNSNKFSENKTIIEFALNKASNVIVPKGTFYTNSIEMPKQTTLKGTNNKLSILKYKGNNTNSLIKIGVNLSCFDVKIENLQLEQTEGLENINAIEFVGNSTAYTIISRCNIFNFSGDGILGGQAGHVNNVVIKENFFSGCKNNINLQYKVGQINAIYIQNNNIVLAKENGILFTGNNVVIENNTIQANKKHAISIGSDNWDTTYNQLTCGSTIQNNYTEQNGNNYENSVIGIYTGYVVGRTYNRIIRKLNIINNYFAEYSADYSIIDVQVDTNTQSSSKSCMLNVQNNYAQTPKFMKFNIYNALSYGTVVKNNFCNLTDSSSYPYWVQQIDFNPNNPTEPHYDNYQNSSYQSDGVMLANTNKQITYLIYYDSSGATQQSLDQAIEQTASKIVVNGHKDWGLAGTYNTLVEKFGNNVASSDGKITKEVASNAVTVVPDISPITLVENHPQITGNATKALQITIAQHNNYAFPYMVLMNFMNNMNYNKMLRVKKLETEIKGGSSAPSGNIDYVGQVYINTSNRKWYVASDLENWREATTN